ncbi:MAG: aspartate-semialdehyde dehydrogenase [Steroidobacteraceae bacterium]|nr:aspartate-semialdehyde dehydrogenase [Nevskiaceae bacterium]MCP5339559.1 aspartate-semialdehyde dehydrogenase [Nevskiaceae bacterium]MCP5359149.1 aspartate-semialdehyde dehydrogenase [Nevskiaceae bacterium]MCP5466383.1 aspartate-semialdehyde dehydrogenase [Nevskiaceae bacterium]MCP5471916.1 aspartate-semialdehyde dehydrogenase [Nevskiaceae bacterium]
MSNDKQWRVAVLGATGLVGETLIKVLEERDFPIAEMYPLASNRSLGKDIRFRGRRQAVIDVESFDFANAELGLFSAGGEVSRQWVPRATAAGCVVIDNTSEFRYEDDVPLVIPEVNPEAIGQFRQRGVIANPNCSTIQMLVALKPLHDAAGIERINVATYQSVSGAGKDAVDELAEQSIALLSGRGPVQPKVVAAQIAFNAVPQIDAFLDNGYTKEEMKMLWETRKIFGDASIRVNATAVRVPVFFGHSEVVSIETRRKLTAAEARSVLEAAPGVEVLDQRRPGGYPTAAVEAANHDTVYVGRIREDMSHERGLTLWIVADNIRKGAATNSVQIAEILVRDHL